MKSKTDCLEMRERSHGLDFLRALMMLLGIVIHALVLEPRIDFLGPYLNDRFLMTIYKGMHTFRMPLFFCISGFFSCLLLYKLKPGKFFINRFKRLALPFILAVLTIGVLTNYIEKLFYFIELDHSFPSAVAAATGYFSDDLLRFKPMHLWFLYYLLLFVPTGFVLYFLAAPRPVEKWLSGYCRKLFARNGFWAGMALFSVVPFADTYFSMSPNIPTTDASFAFSLRCFAVHFFYFSAGWLLYQNRFNFAQLIPKTWWLLSAAAVMTVVSLIFEHKGLEKNILPVSASVGLSTAFYILGFFGLSYRYFNKPSAFIKYLSEGSYWIYLIHYPVICLLSFLVSKPLSSILFVAVLAFVSAFCVISYNYLVRPTLVGKLLTGHVSDPVPFHRISFYRSLFAGRIFEKGREPGLASEVAVGTHHKLIKVLKKEASVSNEKIDITSNS